MIVDLFAGGGGASIGIEAALGRDVDIAINHDPIALAVHKANHPRTRHMEADIWEVKPSDAVGGRHVDLLWASPDCTHFSVAKGAAPRSKGIRSLANVVVDWARDVRPSVIMLENVQEFRTWGPLRRDGRPNKKQKGTHFTEWENALKRLDYDVNHTILDASLYGAPTKRRRLFLVARCDGRPTTWPEETHGPGRLPVRTAAECIDWSIPCPSIFSRKRPLAEKTQQRIAMGIKRFVLTERPFVAPSGKCAAFLAKHFSGVVGQRIDQPAATITAVDHHALVTANLAPEGSDGRTVRAFLTAYYGSDTGGQRINDPMRTLTARHRLGLVTVSGVDYQITDIGMRMLTPEELLRAQFGRFAAGYDMRAAKTQAAKVRLIGNSVCPEMAEALVRANLADEVRVAA